MSQSDQNQIEELYAVVRGRVQGVGFRYFVVQKAQTFGLRGYAHNDSNGDVKVVAQGPRPALRTSAHPATPGAISSPRSGCRGDLADTNKAFQWLPRSLVACK